MEQKTYLNIFSRTLRLSLKCSGFCFWSRIRRTTRQKYKANGVYKFVLCILRYGFFSLFFGFELGSLLFQLGES